MPCGHFFGAQGSSNRADQTPVVKATREPYPCPVVVNTVHELRGGAERVDRGKDRHEGTDRGPVREARRLRRRCAGHVTTVEANGVTPGVEHFGDAATPLVVLANGTTMLSWPNSPLPADGCSSRAPGPPSEEPG